MSKPADLINLRIVALLLLLQSFSVYVLWTLNPVSQTREAIFGLFLAVDLVSFSMSSYIYRMDKNRDGVSRPLLFAGCCMVLLLLYAILLL